MFLQLHCRIILVKYATSLQKLNFLSFVARHFWLGQNHRYIYEKMFFKDLTHTVC